jgi:hypothetical protein
VREVGALGRRLFSPDFLQRECFVVRLLVYYFVTKGIDCTILPRNIGNAWCDD